MLDLVKRIEAEIEKSGFPLELHIIEECRSQRYSVSSNYRYTYMNELREIDVLA